MPTVVLYEISPWGCENIIIVNKKISSAIKAENTSLGLVCVLEYRISSEKNPLSR